MAMVINVSSDDITAGIPNNPTKCALALAIARATGAAIVRVQSKFVHIWWWKNGLHAFAPISEPMQAWVQAFDALRPLGPATFVLELHVSGRI